MPNFPAAPIVANPMQPDNFNYAQAYSTMGQKIGNIAAQGGELYSKIKAYEQVEAKKKDEKAFRTELLSEVTDLMNKNSYDSKSKEIAAYTILNGDLEEAFQKAVKLKENLAIKEANKFDVLPPWGSKEYATTWAGEMKKRQDKELTAQQVGGFSGKSMELPEATEAAVTGGGYESLTQPTKDILAAQKEKKRHELELDKLKVAVAKARIQAKGKGAAEIKDIIAGLKSQHEVTRASIKLDADKIANAKKALEVKIKTGLISETEAEDEMLNYETERIRVEDRKKDLIGLEQEINDLNNTATGGSLAKKQQTFPSEPYQTQTQKPKVDRLNLFP